MNNLRHGGVANTLFLKTENPDQFFALLENAFEQYQPGTDQSAGIVTRTVEDQWILLRRERSVNAFESALHEKKPAAASWEAADIHGMALLDRYKTAAARSYTRSLKDLQLILKVARDEDRWQHQLTMQKQKYNLELEKFQLAKEKQSRAAAKEEEKKEREQQSAAPADPDHAPDPPLATPPPPPAEQTDAVSQTLYIGTEKNKTVVYEVTPSNAKLRRTLTEDDRVTRTYNFVGPVPPEYQYLITPEAYTFGKSTSVHKTYSFEEWNALAASE